MQDSQLNGLVEQAVDPMRYDREFGECPESIAGLLELVPSGAAILDVGAGTGAFSYFAQRLKQATALCIEPDTDRAAACARRGLETRNTVFDEAAAADLPKFDVVVFADVLEHLEAPGQALRLAKTLLNEGGCVLALVPNVAHWTIRLNLLRGRFNYQQNGLMDAGHLRWFTAESVERLFTLSGYTITRHEFSTGEFLPVYNERRPWKWLEPERRRVVLNRLVRRSPTFFGCQHVITAVPAG